MKIERGVPIPDGGDWRTGELGAILRKMEVGDSVMVESAIPKKLGTLLYRTGQTTGWKFTRRTVHGGQRVWRVS